MAAGFPSGVRIFPRPCAAAFALILAALPARTSAQAGSLNEEWRWVQFTTESGLPSNQVVDLAEASDDAVWAATSAGLAWYDGFRWRALRDSLGTSPRPRWIAPDGSGGILYIAGRNLYGVPGGKTQPVELLKGEAGQWYAAVGPAGDGTLIVERDRTVFRFAGGRLEPLPLPAQLDSSGKPNFFTTRGGGVWISTTKGLYRWSGEAWESRTPAAPYHQIQNLVEDANGSGLASIHGPLEFRGLWEWGKSGPARRNENEGVDLIQTMDISPSGEAIAVYESGDIRVRRGSGWTTLASVPSQLRNVLFLKYRRNGDMWVGTESGLFLHRMSNHRWTYWNHPFPDLRNTVHEIVRTREGAVWLGTVQGVEIHEPDGAVRAVSEIGGTKIYIVTGLCEDAEGGVWISSGSMFDGAFRWDGRAWKHFGNAEGLSAGRIHKIRRDLQGRIWFLGLGGGSGGPDAFVYEKGSITNWGAQHGLPKGRLYSFAQTEDGALWFGGMAGLRRWRAGRWTSWTYPEQLRSSRIFSLAAAGASGVWFGDQANGAGRVDERDSVEYATTSEGLVNNEVWDLKSDAAGSIWLSTRGGISRFNKGVWSTFSRSSGLNNLKLWPILPAGDRVYVGTDGNGVNILNLSESQTPAPEAVISTPVIEGDSALLRWQAYPFWGETAPRDIQTRFRVDDLPWSPWSVRREVTLSDIAAGNHMFRVQAKGLFGNFEPGGTEVALSIAPPLYLRTMFAAPVALLSLVVIALGVSLYVRKRKHDAALRESEAKFRSLVEESLVGVYIIQDGRLPYVNPTLAKTFGYTQDEIVALPSVLDIVLEQDHAMVRDNIQRRISGEIQSAHYTFHGRKKDGTGVDVEVHGSRTMYGGKPAVIGMLLDIGERKRAEEALLSYQQELQSLASELVLAEERERRRMAAFLHDTISQSLAFCQMKLEALRQPGSAAELLPKVAEINTLIEQTIENAQSLTFDLSPPVLYELDFDEAVEWLADKFRDEHQMKITCEDDGREKPLGDDLRAVLFQAVREILVNIVKHSGTTSAAISMKREGELLSICIEDRGRGFDESGLGAKGARGGGFGLFNIRERLAHLGGRVDISSAPGRGTRVTLFAPLKHNGLSEPVPAGTTHSTARS